MLRCNTYIENGTKVNKQKDFHKVTHSVTFTNQDKEYYLSLNLYSLTPISHCPQDLSFQEG